MKRLEQSARLFFLEQKLGEPLRKVLERWHWQDNLQHKEIAARLGIPRPTVTRWFKKLGIKSQPCHRFTNFNLLNTGPRRSPPARLRFKRIRKWRFDHTFFLHWSDEMAYVLGLLASDGHVFRNPRGSWYFAFTSTDYELIVKFKVLLGSDHGVTIKKREGLHPNWKTIFAIQIGDKNSVEELMRLGLRPKKHLERLLSKIPEAYLRHFVRGYFDGDGSVGLYKYFRKNRPSRVTVICARFICSSRTHLMSLERRLRLYVGRGHIYVQHGEHSDCYNLVYSTVPTRKLGKFMYDGVTSDKFLGRKFAIFSKIASISNSGP